MPGRNRYDDVKPRYRNLKGLFEEAKAENFSYGSVKPSAPCIFLSHRSTDKAAVRKVGEYITSKGIDIYLDADDANLQTAVDTNDHKAITAAIELGISSSTDLLAFLTKNSMSKESSSVWVPYEIGFAKSHGSFLAAMKSKDLDSLPSYAEIVRKITGIDSLNGYLKEVLERKSTGGRMMNFSAYAASLLLEGASPTHPLSTFLSMR